jgi:hypothetical protein
MDEEPSSHIVDRVPLAVQSDSVRPGQSVPIVVMYNALRSSLYVEMRVAGRVRYVATTQ